MRKTNGKSKSNASSTHIASASPSARAAWTGLLKIGPLACPVRAFSAINKTAGIELHLLHRDCGERIRCPRRCPIHGEVDSAEIVKGTETAPGQHWVPTEADLRQLNPPKDEELDLRSFVVSADLDPLMYNGTHMYLQPGVSISTTEFSTIVDTLNRLKKIGIGTLAFGGKRHLVAVAPRGRQLVLYGLHHPESLRAVPECGPLSEQSVPKNAAAGKFVNARKNQVNWADYCDPVPAMIRTILARATEPKKVERSTHGGSLRGTTKAKSKRTSAKTRGNTQSGARV